MADFDTREHQNPRWIMPDFSTLRAPKSMQTWETTLKTATLFLNTIDLYHLSIGVQQHCKFVAYAQVVNIGQPLPWRRGIVHLSYTSITIFCTQCLQVTQECHLELFAFAYSFICSIYRIPQHVMCQIENSEGFWSHRTYPWPSLSIKCLRSLLESTIDFF